MVLKVKDWIAAAVDHVSKRGFSSTAQSKDEQAESASSKIKALVIDDDLVCRKRLEMILRDYCDCTFAVNGREGYEFFEKQLDTDNPYELVTLDIQMPEMNGHETLEAIRRLEFSREIDGLDGVKVIMTTSREESKHIFGAFKEGCEAYIVKPAGDKMLEEMAKLGFLKATTGYTR
ncbi:MAG: response regulator [Planctomycetes bacterium]|nr:response regulator [Planctomycetota bacterium]